MENLGTVSSWFEVFNRVKEINRDGEIWWVAPVSVALHKEKNWDTITVGVFFDYHRDLNTYYSGKTYQILRKDEHTLIIVYLKKGETI